MTRDRARRANSTEASSRSGRCSPRGMAATRAAVRSPASSARVRHASMAASMAIRRAALPRTGAPKARAATRSAVASARSALVGHACAEARPHAARVMRALRRGRSAAIRVDRFAAGRAVRVRCDHDLMHANCCALPVVLHVQLPSAYGHVASRSAHVAPSAMSNVGGHAPHVVCGP